MSFAGELRETAARKKQYDQPFVWRGTSPVALPPACMRKGQTSG